MSNERDTKFAGFAKLLLDEITSNNDVYFDTSDEHFREDWQEIITRRAYDLAVHIISQREMSSDRLAKTILSSDCFTDLTEWPAQEP